MICAQLFALKRTLAQLQSVQLAISLSAAISMATSLEIGTTSCGKVLPHCNQRWGYFIRNRERATFI